MKHLIQRSKRPQLALVLTALLVIVCRGPQYDAPLLGPGCVVYGTYLRGGQLFGAPEYSCPITCPDGSTVIADGTDDDHYDDIQEIGLAQCPAPAITATATFPPQAVLPTSTVTATPQPLLNGEVSACNLVDRYINLALNPQASAISSSDVEVTIGGQPVRCEIPSSNKNILSCSLPQGQTFPAQVIINVDGHLTDTFSYDGSDCIQPSPTKDDPAPKPDTDLPVCTGEPPYPEGCTPP